MRLSKMPMLDWRQLHSHSYYLDWTFELPCVRDYFYLELKCVQFFSFEWTMAANWPYSYGNICKVKWLLRPNIFPHLDSSFLNLIKSFIVLFICCTITILKVQSRIFAKCMTFCYLNFILLTNWTSEARHMVTLMTQRRILSHICRKGTPLFCCFLRAKRLFMSLSIPLSVWTELGYRCHRCLKWGV